MHMEAFPGCAEKHKKSTCHIQDALYLPSVLLQHIPSVIEKDSRSRSMCSLRNSFSITYLYFIHIKKSIQRTQKVLTNVYKLWFWKKKQKQYSTWVRVPDLLISSPDHQVKWAKFYTRIQRTSESPSTCNRGGPAACSLWVCLRPGSMAGQGSRGVSSCWLWQWRYKEPHPSPDLAV